MDKILMGYWVASQVRTMSISVMYDIKLRMGDTTLRRVIMIPCGILLRSHFRSTKSIDILGSGRGRADGCGYDFDSCGSLREPVPGLLIPLGM